MGIWKQVASQLGGIVKQAGKQLAAEPMEMGQSATNQVLGDSGSADNQAMAMMEQAQATQQAQGPAQGDPANGGFKTAADLERYNQLSGRKDEIELNQIRAKLVGEFGLETSLDQGMQRASMEFEQKEQERKKVVKQKKEEMEWMEQKKKQEEVAITAAKEQGGGEKKAWGAG